MKIIEGLNSKNIAPEDFWKYFQEKINLVDEVSEEIKDKVLSVVDNKVFSKGGRYFDSFLNNYFLLDEFIKFQIRNGNKSWNISSLKKEKKFQRLELYLIRAGLLGSDYLKAFCYDLENLKKCPFVPKENLAWEDSDIRVFLLEFFEENEQLEVSSLKRFRSKAGRSGEGFYVNVLNSNISNADPLFKRLNLKGFSGRLPEGDRFAVTKKKNQILFDEFLLFWNENFPQKSWSLYSLRNYPKYSCLELYFRRNGLLSNQKLAEFAIENGSLLKINKFSIDSEYRKKLMKNISTKLNQQRIKKLNKETKIRNKNLFIDFLKSLPVNQNVFNTIDVRNFSEGLNGYFYREGFYSNDKLKKLLGKSDEKLLDARSFENYVYSDAKVKRVMTDFFNFLREEGKTAWSPKVLESFSSDGYRLSKQYVRNKKEEKAYYWVVFLVKLCEIFGDKIIEEFTFRHRTQGRIADTKKRELPVTTRKKDITQTSFGRDSLASEDLNPEECFIESERAEIEDGILEKLSEFDPILMQKIIDGEIELDTKNPEISNLIEKGREILAVA